MATGSVVLRTSVLLVFFVCLQPSAGRHTPPVISSYTITPESGLSFKDGRRGPHLAKFSFTLRGVGLHAKAEWYITDVPDVYGAQCSGDVVPGSYVREVDAADDKYVMQVTVPVTGDRFYFCLSFAGRWIHQGSSLNLDTSKDYGRENLYADQLSQTLKAVAREDEDARQQVLIDDDGQKDAEDQMPEAIVEESQKLLAEIGKGEEDTSTDGADQKTIGEEQMASGDIEVEGRDNVLNRGGETFPEVLNSFKDKEIFLSKALEHSPNVQDEIPQVETNIQNNIDQVVLNRDESVPVNSGQGVLKPENLAREPFVINANNDLDKHSQEYLSEDFDEFNGNLDEITDGRLDPTKWIDLTHDIDVNYDENGVFRPNGNENVEAVIPTDRFKYLTEKSQSEPKNEVDIVSIKSEKKSEKLQSQNQEENTWNYFKDVSSDRTIPKHWIDLSHDIDVNYPKLDSGVVLDVEGVNVEKNIFDQSKDFEDIEVEPPTNQGEFEGYVEEFSGYQKEDQKSQSDERLETLDKRNEMQSELDLQKLQDDVNYHQRREKREISEASPKTNASLQNSTNRPKLSETTLPDAIALKFDPNTIAKDLADIAGTRDARDERLEIEALRVEHANRDPSFSEDGIPELLAESESILRVFGTGLTQDTLITFTHQPGHYGGPCQFPVTQSFKLEPGSISPKSAKVKVVLPKSTGETFFMCAKRPESNSKGVDDGALPFVHQGSEIWLQLHSYAKILPVWASLVIISTCLMFSALFSGLNLGLLSLDRTELKILCNTGTEREREYARIIQPVRDHGNYLLCSILLGNVAVNSTFTILLDDLTSGLFAVIFSTITIVLLGEITPQAICSRHGLAVGAKTIAITKAVMGITFPLSYPVSKLLDCVLGEEIGNVYNRERLKELVKVTNDINDLDKDEVNIISGALEMRKKTVLEIMTKIEDVFMLDYEAVLDFETVSEIMKSGFSRIPVYESKRTAIVAMLYVKDLAFVDPDDNTPLKTLCQFYQNPCNFVFEDVTLDVIFRQFKEGHKGHLAFVQRVNSEGEGDPFYETIGLVTLEDVIEELIQAEIMDETDVFTDNKSKRRRNHQPNKLQDFGVFAERRENQRIRISPQLTLATFQYLSTSLDAFKPDNVSETILRRMLKQDIIHHIKFRNKERQKSDPATLIYEQGKPVDYFVLILEGRVEVTVGRECLVFESGPFTYFGCQALMQNVCVAESPVIPPTALGSLQSINMDALLRYTFVPDYSVRAITEVFYVSIKRSLYLAAKRATLMEKCASNRFKGLEDAGEQFDDEVEKLLHSLEEEGSPTPQRSPSHHLNSHHVSPTPQNTNGSIKTMSRQASPVHQLATLAEPERLDPILLQEGQEFETSTLLPHSKS